MKKNLISVIILALVFANLAMTAILMITVVPQAKKSNELIQKVCSAIDLELSSGETANAQAVPIADVETFSLADSMTINLKKDTDGKDHYAVITVTLSLNKKDEGYKTYQPMLETNKDLIKTTINNVVSEYTYDQITSDQQQVQDAILEELQAMYDGSSFIVGVGFSSATYQ